MTVIAPDFVPRAAAIHSAHRGDVIPPPSVVRRLQEKSPRLGLRWMTGAHLPYWAVTQRWAGDDPRWARVQSGEVPEASAFDIAHIFTLDVTTEDMAAYIEQRWSETAHRKTGGEAVKLADQTVTAQHQRDVATQNAHIARVTQESWERHERESRHDLRVRAGVEQAHPLIVVP